MASHSVRLPRAASERRGRFFFAEYERTESVCPREVPRYCLRRARNSFGIDDGARGESEQERQCECAALLTREAYATRSKGEER